jgi:alkylhydroperoxidase family enzyme
MADRLAALDDDMTATVDALGSLEPAAWNEADRLERVELFTLVAGVCADQHRLPPLAVARVASVDGATVGPVDRWRSLPDLGDAERALLELSEQFSVDVSSITDAQRSALFGSWGVDAATAVAIVFVMDFLPRTRAALDALGWPLPPDRGGPPRRPDASGIWEALDRLMRAAPRLDGLDPVTSELVRLRGARQHRCRLCQSLRSRPALLAGADEALLTGVEDFENSDLSPLQKAALALTDAMIWCPGSMEGPAARLRSAASPAQCLELVADVTRNALNKIAVALAADEAHVEDGIEIYDVDADGGLVYGLSVD